MKYPLDQPQPVAAPTASANAYPAGRSFNTADLIARINANSPGRGLPPGMVQFEDGSVGKAYPDAGSVPLPPNTIGAPYLGGAGLSAQPQNQPYQPDMGSMSPAINLQQLIARLIGNGPPITGPPPQSASPYTQFLANLAMLK